MPISVLTDDGERPMEAWEFAQLTRDMGIIDLKLMPGADFSRFLPPTTLPVPDLPSFFNSESDPFLTRQMIVEMGLAGQELNAKEANDKREAERITAGAGRDDMPGSSLAITEAILHAQAVANEIITRPALIAAGIADSRTRLEVDNSLSPYAVAHGVELALQDMGIEGVTNLPPTDKNFTTISASQYRVIKTKLGDILEPDVSSHGSSSSSVPIDDRGYSLKFYLQPDGNYQAAIVHDTWSFRHILVDLPEFKLRDGEVNGSIAEAYGDFTTVDEQSLARLKAIANSSRYAATAFDDFNTNHPNQFVVTRSN